MDLRGCRMVWLGPMQSQVAFWMLFTHSAFKRKPTGKSIGGHRKSTRGKQGTKGGPQEEAESSFHYFEGVRVGEKGG